MDRKVLYYDCFSGISGDMNLAALVDLGVPQEHLRAQLATLGLGGYTLRFARDERNGIHGTRADVVVEGGAADATVGEPAVAGHEHEHEHAHHHDHAAPEGGHHHDAAGHAHRSHADIVRLIEASALVDGAKKRALAIFKVLAEAEAKVHDMPVDQVRFHEVGAVDSIVDIVGAAVCLEHLKPDRILASTVELGGGFVKTAHGLLPVPAPATAEILSGVPIRSGAVPFETTTPTGAAILAACVDEFTDDKSMVVERVAYGVGHRVMEIPNLLRVFLGRETERTARGQVGPYQEGCILECNVDDMSPELHGYLFELLFAAGASDVYFTPIVMKKSRPAVTLSVLCAPEAEARIAELILRETTSFGLRRLSVGKLALDRQLRTVRTSLGDVRVKTAYLGGKPVKSKPEYEDCRRIAEERTMALRDVYAQLVREIQ